MTDTAAAPTYSHIAVPSDHRCRWWQKALPIDTMLATNPADIEGGNDVPGTYMKKNADHELAAWTAVLDSEAKHHKKDRGFSYTLGIIHPNPNVEGELTITWIGARVAPQKAAIKAAGASHLMGGSGDAAHLVRMARWILEADTDEARLERIATLKAA